MKRYPVLFLILAIALIGHGQHGFDNSLTHFSNVTNHVDVNRNNFVVTNAGSDFANYHYSVLKLGTELAKLGGQTAPYNQGAQASYNLGSTPVNLFGRYTAYRLEYTEPITCWIFGTTRLRSIIVRPNTALPNSPMVLVSHGLTGNIGDFGSSFIVQIADLLMRGYVVMYYENLGSSRTLSSGTKIHDAVAISGMPVNNANYTQHLLYLNGEAAAKLAASSIVTGLVGTDPSRLFALGFSLGSGVSSTVLLGKRADFSPNLNSASLISPKDDFTYVGVRSTQFNVRGGVILGGSLPALKPGMTNLLDPSDANKRWLSIFGTADYSAYPYSGSADWDSYQTVDTRLSAIGMKHYMNPICGAGHTLFGEGTTAVNLIGSSAMTSMLAIVSNTLPENLTAAVPATNAALIDFKKLNTQAFQMGSTTAKFITSTIANTATAMNFCENVEHIKCNSSNLSLAFCCESSWVFSFENICGGIVYNYPCTTAVSKQAMSKEGDSNLGLRAYPNPTSGIVTVDMDERAQMDLGLEIRSVDGLRVHQSTIPEGSSSCKLDLSGLPGGIYLLRIQYSDGHHTSLRLMKQ